MLKIWKQAWRKDSTTRDDTDGPQSSLPDADEPISQPSTTIPYVVDHEVLGPVISSQRTSKRVRGQEQEDFTEGSRTSSAPIKRHRSGNDTATCSSNATELELPASCVGQPSELVVFYDPQFREKQTTLFKQLHSQDPREQIFRRYFRDARSCFNSLGACASDLVWRRALKEIEASTAMVYEEDEELETGSKAAIAKSRLNMWNILKNWDFNMPNIDPTSRGFNVTPKFEKLVRMLQACELYGDSFRGIVFVHKRIVANIIADMLRMLDDHNKFLRPQVLSGHALLSDQHEILEGFRAGTHNLLILTKASEDLEILPSNTVIRFDLFESHVSYAFCRALTNGSENHLIHMAERGSDMHRRMLSHLARLDGKMEAWVMRFCKDNGSATPPSELRVTTDPYRSDSEDEENDTSKFIQDPTTSGRIYSQDAITVLYRFVSCLQTSNYDNAMKPLFEFEEFTNNLDTGQSFICTVLLPRGLPVTRISGPPCSSKSLARRMACYQTCTVLSQQGYLDYQLLPRAALPTSKRQRRGYMSAHVEERISDEDDDDVSLPVIAKQERKYTSTRPYPVKSPDFWSNSSLIMRGCLYPTVILSNMKLEGETSTLYAPLLLLTRLPLPSLPSFNIFLAGMPNTITLRRGAAFDIDEDKLKLLYRYTLRIFRAVANKPLVCPLQNMSYFIAPLPKTWALTEDKPDLLLPDVGKDIQWEKVELSAEKGAVALKTQDLSTLEEDIDDAVVQDRKIEFTRRYFCVRMRPDLNPLSKPEDSLRERNFENLLEYCKDRRKDFDGLQNYQQPLIQVECIPSLVNHLNPTSKPFENRRRAPAKYLIPELCEKFTVPASTFRTCLLMPSVLRRIDDLLLVKELNSQFFDHAINERYLLEAISAPSTSVEFNYERLELLGDAYLKYLSSVYLFVINPSKPEGDLHVARQRIISNQSLLRNADRRGIPQFIQSKPFSVKSWVPPNWHVSYRPRIADGTTHEPTDLKNGQGKSEDVECEQPKNGALSMPQDDGISESGIEQNISSVTNISNKSLLADISKKESIAGELRKKAAKRKVPNNDDNVQWLGDKAVADVAEAIIGAAFATGGREIALKVTKALNVPVPHVDQWSDFRHKALAPPPDVTIELKEQSVKAVEAIIGTKFNHPHLLAQALTHASVPGNEMACYERYEFIGDAILDFLVIRHIFDRDISLSPGALTLLKGAMVSNSALAALCVWSGLHKYLILESIALADHIQLYAKELKVRQSEEYDSAKKENRSAGQYWLEIEPPKALSDVIESILGALYVSDNFSSVGAEAFFNKVLKPFYNQHITLNTLSHHPTKVLFELLQSEGCQNFEILKEHTASDYGNPSVKCDVVVHDIVLSSAIDTTSAFAARRASLWALDALEGDPGFMLRTCNCHALSQSRKAERKRQREMHLAV